MSPKRVLFFEFRPQPADAFRARFWHPTKTSAEEGVFLFPFEVEPAGFFVEATEFLCELHPLGKSLGKSYPLASRNADAMKAGNGIPADVALRVERPVRRDQNHCPVGRDVDGELEQQGLVVLHPIEIPPQTEGVERRTENVVSAAQVH